MTMSRIQRLLAALCCPVLLLGAALAQADQFDSARVRIRNVMTAHNIPSVTVAVAYQGKIVWEEGFGWADVGKRIPATPHTQYALASISKPITATALMMLVERGAIDLDRPIDDYLGPQKITARIGQASAATVRRVASHTSGLPLHARFFYEDETGNAPPLDETIRRYAVLVTPPGEAFVYSNLGYGLLERAIEHASGKTYAEFVRNELFVPLGLNEAAANLAPDEGKRMATPYWGDHVVPWNDSDHQGSGAAFMSAHDLVRFGMFHLHGKLDGQQRSVVQHSTLISMRDAALLNDGSSAGYGIGWFVGEQHGLRYFGHNGGRAGAATVLAIYPDQQAVIVVLGNGISRIGAVHFLEGDIMHALLPETIRQDHGFKPQPEWVGRWQGRVRTYSGDIPVELEFKQNGSVFARIGSNPVQEAIKAKFEAKTSVLELNEIVLLPKEAEALSARPEKGVAFSGLIGDLGTPDAARHPGPLQLSLKLRGANTLNGSISSNSLETLSDRMGSAVSYWVELNKK